MYEWKEEGSSGWVWGEELHGGISELAQVDLPLTRGKTTPVGKWNFHDAYCGVGGFGRGLALAGGICTGAFDREKGARAIYEKRMGHRPHGAWGSFDVTRWKPARVLISAPPCEDVPWLLGRNEERQMWQHLKLVRTYQYDAVNVHFF